MKRVRAKNLDDCVQLARGHLFRPRTTAVRRPHCSVRWKTFSLSFSDSVWDKQDARVSDEPEKRNSPGQGSPARAARFMPIQEWTARMEASFSRLPVP
jgi:hypothetical protein